MRDNVFGNTVVGIVVAAVLAVIARHGGGFTSWATAGVALGAGLLAVLVLAIASRGRSTSAARGSVTVHSHGGYDAITARHEIGHKRAVEAAGGRVTAVVIHRGGGGGYTSYDPPKGGFGPAQQLSIDYAGGIAAGTWTGCDSDLEFADETLRAQPRRDRGPVKRAGRRLARRATAGGVFDNPRSQAARLLKTGKW